MKYKKINTYKQKKIARLAQEGAVVSVLDKEYNVPRSSIYNWMGRYGARHFPRKMVPTKEYNDLKSHSAKADHELKITQDFIAGLGISHEEKYKYMDKLYGAVSIRELCDAMMIDRGTYYNHLRILDKISSREARRAFLMDAIYQSWLDSRRMYGAEKIWIDLKKIFMLAKRWSES